MAHTELDLRERRMIETMLNAKIPVSKIAVEIGRHRSTVYRRRYATASTEHHASASAGEHRPRPFGTR